MNTNKHPNTCVCRACAEAAVRAKPEPVVSLPVLRASSAPLAVACPGSTFARAGEVLVDAYKADGTGTVGQNVHRAVALAVQDFLHDTGIERFTLTDEEDGLVERALAWLAAMKFLEAGNGKVFTEHHLTTGPFSGTLDFLRVLHTSADVADFKNTYREDDYEPQVLAYAFLVFSAFPDVQTVNVYLPFLRKGYVADKSYDRDWVLAWAEEMKRNVIGAPIYRPGAHCQRCKRRNGCSALAQTVRQTVDELSAIVLRDKEFTSVSLSAMADLWPRVKLVRQACELYRDAVERIVEETGFMPVGDGKEVRKIEIQMDQINVLKAWPLLQEKFPNDEDMGSFITVGKGKMLDLLADKSPRRKKQKAKDDFLLQLEQTGALSKVDRTQLREVKVGE